MRNDTAPILCYNNSVGQKDPGQEETMMNVIICTSNEDWITPLASAPGEFQIHITAQPSFSGTADCVLLSQQFVGSRLADTIRHLKEFHIPCAVVTYDTALENQERLLALGADDVIVLPLCTELLRKRILSLAETPAHSDAEMNFAVFDRILEATQGNGSFIVAEHDFMNIYRFVSRVLERLEKQAELLIFNFSCEEGPFLESSSALHFLKVVQTSLRRGDIICNYGKQILVILMGSDEQTSRQVAERVIGAFNAHYNMDESCTVTCQMREIIPQSGHTV